jgi:2-C-methyl-D-erythritol 4-phosphate cytidylyltransferase
LWRAQTPQSFRTAALRSAHLKALEDHRVVTDDASLLEFYGGSIVVVPGDNRNMKITYPEDFALAEAYVASGTRG